MFSFIETKSFTRTVNRYLSGAMQYELQLALLENPKLGAAIPGSGGIRKLRWGRKGHGKRGGLRVIYSVDWSDRAILLLAIYAKNEMSDIPLHILRKIREQF